MIDSPYFFFLDSSLRSENSQRSFAVSDPKIVVTSEKTPHVLKVIQDHLRKNKGKDGIWVGYLGYEYYAQIEKSVATRRSDLIPEAVFCFYDTLSPLPDLSLRQTCLTRQTRRTEAQNNFTQSEYLTAIHKIKNYITAGDCYQVNLSQRFSCTVEEEPFEIYKRLRAISPAPYSAYLNLGQAQILSASPECFLKLENGKVTTRPIKGTRRRGKTSHEDALLKEELMMSSKDRAELLMITDLLRNDLGRVCEPGSVHVSKLMEVESFSQVHHLVSTVEGRLSKEKDAIDLLRATFPGGSITGAPKIRAMQIIHELETVPRNVYTGTIGYIDLKGNAQFNIAIRTMIYKGYPHPPFGSPLSRQVERVNRKGIVYFWGGGGIVADSDPLAEYEETLTKIGGLSKALTVF